jgi:hypothetical protein
LLITSYNFIWGNEILISDQKLNNRTDEMTTSGVRNRGRKASTGQFDKKAEGKADGGGQTGKRPFTGRFNPR